LDFFRYRFLAFREEAVGIGREASEELKLKAVNLRSNKVFKLFNCSESMESMDSWATKGVEVSEEDFPISSGVDACLVIERVEFCCFALLGPDIVGLSVDDEAWTPVEICEEFNTGVFGAAVSIEACGGGADSEQAEAFGVTNDGVLEPLDVREPVGVGGRGFGDDVALQRLKVFKP
jgi:hypothetical protein